MTGLLDLVAVAFLAGIVATVVEAVRRRDVSAGVNGTAALGAALLPPVADAGLRACCALGAALGPELTLWIAAAGFLHSVGMLGFYESVWWWDHLTHTLSAALVAALAYAGFLVVARDPSGGGLPVVVATLLFVGLIGVFWELLEVLAREVGERHGVDPILVIYGRWDTVLDMAFNVVGAVLVVAVDLRTFVPVAEQSPGTTETLLFGTAALAAVGSVAIGLVALVLKEGS